MFATDQTADAPARIATERVSDPACASAGEPAPDRHGVLNSLHALSAACRILRRAGAEAAILDEMDDHLARLAAALDLRT